MKTKYSVLFLLAQLILFAFVWGYKLLGPLDMYGAFVIIYLYGYPCFALLVSLIITIVSYRYKFKDRHNLTYLIGTVIMWPLVFLIGFSVLSFQRYQEEDAALQEMIKNQQEMIEPILQDVAAYQYAGWKGIDHDLS